MGDGLGGWRGLTGKGRCWLVLTAGVAVAVALGGCSNGSSKTSSSSFSIRPATGEVSMPCPAPPNPLTTSGVLPKVQGGKTVGCVQVGPAAITKADVAQASAVQTAAGGWAVNFVLTKDGSDRFDRLAAAQYGKTVATEVDGSVTNVVTVNTTTFNGRGELNGFDEATAKRVAKEL